MENEIWYHQDAPAEDVVRVGKELWGKQGEERISLAEDSLALYLGSARHSLRGSSNPFGVLEIITDAAGYNGIQAIVDTKVNTVLKSNVRPMFITDGADNDTKRRAEFMQRACDGIRYAQGLQGRRKRRAVAVAGYVFEAGGIEWYADIANSRVVATEVWCWEFFVSRREARHGEPQQLFSRHTIDRGVLLSYLKGSPAAVRRAVQDADPAPWRDTQDETRDGKRVADQVVVYKAWHLPSGRVDMDEPEAWGKNEDGNKCKPSHDGRHVVALDGGDSGNHVSLIDVPWPHDHFPVAWFKPNYVPGSYWGRGEPEILAAQQIEANRWNTRVTQVVNKHAVPRTYVSKDSGLNPASMNNNIDNIYQVKGPAGAAVHVEAAPAMPPDLIRRLGEIPQMMRDQRGMSEMSMTARKPAGMNHEPGLAYLGDTESMRHTDEMQAWEEFNLDCDKNIIRCLDELAENDPNYEVVFEKDEQLIREKWKDVRLNNSFVMKLWPTNLFKQDPAQRADQIAGMVDKGLFPKEKYFDAIDAPDVKSLMGNRAAMARNVDRCLQYIVKHGEFTDKEAPHPYMDLQLAKQSGIERLNETQVNEPDNYEVINALSQWLEAVDEFIAKATPPAMAPPPGANLQALGPAAAMPPQPGQPQGMPS